MEWTKLGPAYIAGPFYVFRGKDGWVLAHNGARIEVHRSRHQAQKAAEVLAAA